ncbi:DUF721 domain-containing protein [bacterium]|nr:DUF721 domain-containing protein [bacterium]
MKSLNVVLHKFFKDHGIEESLKRHSVMRDWEEIVGQRIANVTTPHRVSNGILFVRVKSDAWRHELLFHKAKILQTISADKEKATIKDIVWF